MEANFPKELLDKLSPEVKPMSFSKVLFEQNLMRKAFTEGATEVKVTPLQPGDIVNDGGVMRKVRRIDGEGNAVFEPEPFDIGAMYESFREEKDNES